MWAETNRVSNAELVATAFCPASMVSSASRVLPPGLEVEVIHSHTMVGVSKQIASAAPFEDPLLRVIFSRDHTLPELGGGKLVDGYEP